MRNFCMVVAAFFLLLHCGSVRAEKTDVIYLHNGDRVTGEIKSLIRGKLEFSTEHMGTVLIDWEDIMEIVSGTNQSIELTDGQRFSGALDKPEHHDKLIISTQDGPVELGTNAVVSVYPVSATFADRLDVSASLGLSWDKASDVGKYTIGADAEYRQADAVTRAGFTYQLTTQEERDDTQRASLDVNHFAFRKNKRFLSTFGRLETNDELGVDFRTLLGMGYGWMPAFTQRNWLALMLGANVNYEVPTIGNQDTNLELVAGLSYDYFRYTDPERRLAVKLYIFPSVTDSGRVRANFDASYNLELWSDLFWKLDFYSAYDNEPISVAASTLDYGFTSSVAYKF
jgi:hypothetical protein